MRNKLVVLTLQMCQCEDESNPILKKLQYIVGYAISNITSSLENALRAKSSRTCNLKISKMQKLQKAF